MPMPDDADMGRVLGEVAVTYTVKELLSRIEERVVRLDQMMAQLPTRDEVEQLRQIVSQHEARWNRVLGAAVAVAALAGGAAGWTTSLLAGG